MNARNSLAMAVLLATASFSSVVAASEVKMYGQIDNAIAYTKAEGENGKVTMDPSVDIPSKWGIMGREDLGSGNYVRFNLEQGFAPDAGTMTWSDRIFGREALVMIGGNWGELALGRTGTFFGSIGTYGQWAKMGINPMQTNYSDATLGGVFTATGMASNSITYQVKPIDTLTLTAQYVNGDHEDYEWSQDDHLYQLAAFYKNADLSVGLIYAMTQYGHTTSDKIAPNDAKPSHNVMLSASKNVGSVRVYTAYQHVWNSRVIGGAAGQFTAAQLGASRAGESDEGFTADAFMIGANMPALGGKVFGAAKVVHAKWEGLATEDQDTSGTRWVLSGKYRYDLSKRTDVYAIASYANGDGMFDYTPSKATRLVFATGISHRF